jgi:S1-C subfamily serine protease
MTRRFAALFVLISLSVAAVAADKARSGSKPWLGMALVLKAAPDGGRFLYVAHAPESAPAYVSGIRPGDLIVRIGGKPITFRDDVDILEYTSKLTPGRSLKLRLVRAGKEQDVNLRIGVLPPEYEPLLAESLRKAREARERATH